MIFLYFLYCFFCVDFLLSYLQSNQKMFLTQLATSLFLVVLSRVAHGQSMVDLYRPLFEAQKGPLHEPYSENISQLCVEEFKNISNVKGALYGEIISEFFLPSSYLQPLVETILDSGTVIRKEKIKYHLIMKITKQWLGVLFSIYLSVTIVLCLCFGLVESHRILPYFVLPI